jgi:hypothetical protein
MSLILPPPSEQTKESELEPDGLRPAYGVRERRHHDLVVPLLYPWRERGQSCWRVGRLRLMLVVVDLSGELGYKLTGSDEGRKV